MCKISVGVYDHGYIQGDVSVLPVGISHGRLDSRDVEQLVDELQEVVSLSFYDGCLFCVLWCGGLVLLEVVAESEYDGEWGSELVCDVGDEMLAHGACLRELSMAFGADSECVVHGGEHHG